MSRNSFTALVEIDGAEIEMLNRKLRRLGDDLAPKALRNGFRKWTTLCKRTAKTLAPRGPSRPTEKVRGTERPNPHISDFITTKVKGYSKGRVVWAAVGVKEIRGSYATPHWYLRWVEFGHKIKRRATQAEQILLKSRGNEKKKEYSRITIGEVRGTFFLRKTLSMCEPRLVPAVEDAIAAQIEKNWEVKRGR
jgi:hypothetical protein